MENQAVLYFEENPTARKFKLHNFRGMAITNAKRLGVSFEEAAVAFGCDPETMRQHYLALDEVAITDRVMAEIQGAGVKEGGTIRPGPTPRPSRSPHPEGRDVGRIEGDRPQESRKDSGLVALSPLLQVPKRGLEPPRAR